MTQQQPSSAIQTEFQRGLEFHRRGQLPEAERAYREVLKINERHFDANHNLGIILYHNGQAHQALKQFDIALKINPGSAEAYNSRGNILRFFRQWNKALSDYDKAITIRPDYADAFNNRGLALVGSRNMAEALASFDRALAIKPDLAGAHHNKAETLAVLCRFDEALASINKAYALNPDLDLIAGMKVYLESVLCDWGDKEHKKNLLERVRKGQRAAVPFPLLLLPSSPEDQLKCARTYLSRGQAPAASAWKGARYAHKKIRVAYISSDFHKHATAHLMAGLFETHDRARFATFAFSYGIDDKSETRKRLVSSFDNFIDVRSFGDDQIADMIREREIDIAVDLKGFTQDSRMNILASRPAPVQVSYLGYPGTTGTAYIDYIIADRVVLPPEMQAAFSEKAVYLPGSYQVNDRKREISPKTPSRVELGLPENAFVFCCFNNNNKITPEIFDIWMNLLKTMENSVLWLLESNSTASVNLRREAQRREVQPERLIFAPRTDLEYHLVRHSQADLFLDTLPCNAHTTASDALWAGLPVLTCLGSTFAGRVAGSLLQAVGLPELVMRSLEEYERLALRLASNPQDLAAIKAKLAKNRDIYPLFDTERFTRHLETAYTMMWQRSQRDEAPESFDVPGSG